LEPDPNGWVLVLAPNGDCVWFENGDGDGALKPPPKGVKGVGFVPLETPKGVEVPPEEPKGVVPPPPKGVEF